MQILEQRTQRTRTCLWITKAHRPDGSWIYLSSPQISYQPNQMYIWVQHKSSGQVVTTSVIVQLLIFVRLCGAFEKIHLYSLFMCIWRKLTFARDSTRLRVCEKNTRSRMHGIRKSFWTLLRYCLLNASPMKTLQLLPLDSYSRVKIGLNLRLTSY